MEKLLTGIKETLTPEKKVDEFTLEDSDLEALPRKDFMALMFKNMGDMLDDKLKPVTEKIDLSDASAVKNSIRQQVEKFQDSHKDFTDWKPELAAKIKANPGMSIDDAYVLVRSGDPDKAKELDIKFADGDINGPGKKKGEGKEFGSMRSSTGDRSEQRHDMDADEAADAAWDEVMGEGTDTVEHLF